MRRVIFFLFLANGSVIISSCGDLTQKRFEFYYYPAKNVYFDVSDRLYLYSLNGGKTWDSTAAITTEEPAILGRKEILYSKSPQIWIANETHIKQYNARVINITGVDTGLGKQNLAAERKTKKIRANISEKTPEKKPGFFKRLFGKKN